jgi:hypothetical protein
VSLSVVSFDQALSMTDSAIPTPSSIAQLKEPNARVLEVLLRHAHTAKVEGDLIAAYLEDQNKQDLVALKVSSDNDGDDTMTTFFRDRISGLWSTKVYSTPLIT